LTELDDLVRIVGSKAVEAGTDLDNRSGE
ncbi:TetR/AcrR family transcriptional regulator, partial [Rhodococcus hoagii]|nr:TetR/AcrR family transcriptional regulator [Prescottella equi]